MISFRYEPIPGESNQLTGDLIINVQRAHEEGVQRGDRNFELAFYIAHGFDHLNGATDDTPQKRTSMHHREKNGSPVPVTKVSSISSLREQNLFL